ncbi:ATP-binding protein [Paludisphaera soli]|uniref:ATP-binding protein n=1 Tax=Paludisphaera soli TaxID=2712865 RepID=UPI0013ED397F|nr:ATP-binding protein [Paludisphaera soli]
MIDPRDFFRSGSPLRDGDENLFQGRQDLIHKVLHAIGSQNPVTLLCGEPGVGKSSLAWQVMRVLEGRNRLLRHLDLRPSYPVKPSLCVWLQCNGAMRDLEDVLLALMTVRTAGPSFRSLAPELYRPEFERLLSAAAERNLQRPSRRADREAGESLWQSEALMLFNRLLQEIRRVHQVKYVTIFLDDLDSIGGTRTGESGRRDDLQPEPLPLNNVVDTGGGMRLVVTCREKHIAGPVDGESVPVMWPVWNAFPLKGLQEDDLDEMFKTTEDAAGGLIRFSSEYKQRLLTFGEGATWLFHTLGASVLSSTLRKVYSGERRFPLVLGGEDLDHAVDQLLTPSRPETFPEDPYRVDRLITACESSRVREAVIFALAKHDYDKDEWVPEAKIRQFESVLPHDSISVKQALESLSSKASGVLMAREEHKVKGGPRAYRFLDHITWCLARMARTKGEGTLSGLKGSIHKV